MVRTQILVPRWGAEQGFQRCFVAVDVTYQGLVLSLAQARFGCVLQNYKAKSPVDIFFKTNILWGKGRAQVEKGKKKLIMEKIFYI